MNSTDFTKKIKVLVVDDTQEDCELIESMLEDHSLNVESFQSLENLNNVKTLLERDHFDVAILDLNLKESAGDETIKKFSARALYCALTRNLIFLQRFACYLSIENPQNRNTSGASLSELNFI